MAYPNEEKDRSGFGTDRDEERSDAAQPERPAQAAQAAQELGGDEARPELAAENAELKDRLLRAMAETENVRRRAERERTEAAQYGLTNFARDVVGVADNLRRALDSMGPDARGQIDEATRALIEGVEMTERELLNVLERHKIRTIDPKGERFDPNFHQAMFEVEQPDAAPGTVVQVIQTGYVIGDRLLRPALVGVAKASAASRDNDGSAARLDTSA